MTVGCLGEWTARPGPCEEELRRMGVRRVVEVGAKKATERGAEYDTIALIDELRVCLTASEVEKAEGDNLGTGMEVVSETETETVKVV